METEKGTILAEVKQYVEDAAEELTKMHGELTSGAHWLIRCQAVTLQGILAAEQILADPPGDDADGRLMFDKNLRSLVALENTFRHGQVALGLAAKNPQTKRVPRSIDEVLAAYQQARGEREKPTGKNGKQKSKADVQAETGTGSAE